MHRRFSPFRSSWWRLLGLYFISAIILGVFGAVGALLQLAGVTSLLVTPAVIVAGVITARITWTKVERWALLRLVNDPIVFTLTTPKAAVTYAKPSRFATASLLAALPLVVSLGSPASQTRADYTVVVHQAVHAVP